MTNRLDKGFLNPLFPGKMITVASQIMLYKKYHQIFLGGPSHLQNFYQIVENFAGLVNFMLYNSFNVAPIVNNSYVRKRYILESFFYFLGLFYYLTLSAWGIVLISISFPNYHKRLIYKKSPVSALRLRLWSTVILMRRIIHRAKTH